MEPFSLSCVSVRVNTGLSTVHKLSAAELVERLATGGGKRVISVPDTIFSIRRDCPTCEHTDDELKQLIATIAISNRCDLSFEVPTDFEIAMVARRNDGF